MKNTEFAYPASGHRGSQESIDIDSSGCREILRSAVSDFRLVHQVKDEVERVSAGVDNAQFDEKYEDFLICYKTLKKYLAATSSNIDIGVEPGDDDVTRIQELYDRVTVSRDELLGVAKDVYSIEFSFANEASDPEVAETLLITHQPEQESQQAEGSPLSDRYYAFLLKAAGRTPNTSNLTPEQQDQYAEFLDKVETLKGNFQNLQEAENRGKSTKGLVATISRSLAALESEVLTFSALGFAAAAEPDSVSLVSANEINPKISTNESNESLGGLAEAQNLGRRQLEAAEAILETATKAGVAEGEVFETVTRLLGVLERVTNQSLDASVMVDSKELHRLEQLMVKRIHDLIVELNPPLTKLSRSANAAIAEQQSQPEVLPAPLTEAVVESEIALPVEAALLTSDEAGPVKKTGWWNKEFQNPKEDVVPEVAPQGVAVVAPEEVVVEQIELRDNWLAAMREHNEKQAAYRDSVSEYYASLQDKTGVAKTWLKLKSAVGISPTLPPEFEIQRQEMMEATARYNALAREQVEKREPSLKSQAIPGREAAVMARYQKMLARATLLKTFETQLDEQKKATENLSLRSDSFFARNRKAIGIVGAATIGGLTGGIAMGGFAAVRALAGGAAAAATTRWLAPKLDGYVENVQRMSDEKFTLTVTEIESKLGQGSLSSEDFNEIYNTLTTIYQRVDSAKQQRVLGLIGAAMVTGLAFGAGAGQAMEAFNIGSDVLLETDNKIGQSNEGVQQAKAGLLQSEGATPAAAAEQIDSLIQQSEELSRQNQLLEQGSSVENAASYTVQKGDNMWDVLEGQTKAGKLAFLNEVNPEMKQQLFKLVETRLANDAALRSEIGFGDTPQDLQEGKGLNIEKLNKLTLEIAGDKGLLYDPEVHGPLESSPTEGAPGAAEGSTDTPPVEPRAEALAPKAPETSGTVDAQTVEKYIKGPNVGEVAFARDFRGVWVEKIQGPLPQPRSFFPSWLSVEPLKADAYEHFANLSMDKFSDLGKMPAPKLADYLQTHKIEAQDFKIWQTEALRWQATPTLKIVPGMSFDELAKAAYVAEKLNAAKPVT